jgi:L-rhamnonate dehydratase
MLQDLKSSRKSWGIDVLGTVVVEVELHSGVVGVGVSTGGNPACYLVEKHLV